MKIYASEIADGLGPLLQASASISYACVAEPYNGSKKDVKYFKSMASVNDEDLYYVQSILVSSSWNKNDDIFDKAEVWVAKNTPEHKPTNLEHDEEMIVGHIVSNWPITEDGILIDENTPVENLPDKYHILTGSVIYTGFSNPELKERSSKLISEIQDGTKYVSMECFFKGFDYGLLDKSTGKYTILNRNEATAYLTKFLRAYGGVGEHENYKIGRVLRHITFTGKGFVNKPANEDSVIFSKNLIMPDDVGTDNEEKNQEIVNSGVLNFQSNKESETLTMSSAKQDVDMNTTEATNEVPEVTVNASELQAKIEELTLANETLKNAMTALAETKDAEVTLTKEEAAKKVKEKEDEMNSKDEEMKKVKSELETALNTIAEYIAKEEAAMKKDKKMKRVASLVEAGVDAATAETTVDKFENLDDDAFSLITSLLVAKKASKKEEMKDEETEEDAMMMKKYASEQPQVEADPSVLETAEVEASVNLGVGSDDAESALESTRAALVEFVCSKLGKKQK